MRRSATCRRLPGVCSTTVIFALSCLTVYLFYRNSALKDQSAVLYMDLDTCKENHANEIYVRDTELKLVAEKDITSWEQLAAALRNRPDRRAVHGRRNDTFSPPSAADCDSCELYDLDAAADDRYDCVTLKVDPEAPICPYESAEDASASASIRERGIWREEAVGHLQHWLRRDARLGLVDVGCSVGVYTIAAAVLRASVVSVDPSLENLRRLHRALTMGQLESGVTALHNSIGDLRGRAEVVTRARGRASAERRPLGDPGADVPGSAGGQLVRTILLDDLVPLCPFRSAIVNVALNGFEHRAFSNASALFEFLAVPVVLMEWEAMKAFYWLPLANHDRELVEAMIGFFLRLDYTPVSWERRVLHVQLWDLWPSDILWVHKSFNF